MSLVQVVNVKGIHKSAVIRNTIRYRVKTAFVMIVTRGADVVVDKKGQEEIIFREDDIGSHWITPSKIFHIECNTYSYVCQTGLMSPLQRWSFIACLILK